MKQPPKKVPAKWIRNRSDQLAIEAGHRFDSERGQFVVNWIETHCVIYEGDFAGQPLKLLDWQKDVLMRTFGWVKYSERYSRWIRRFRNVTVFASKKSGKTPLIAFIGLFMLCADGEKGARIVIAATKIDQAAISQKHAIKTVEKSPALDEICKVNATTKAIICESKDAWMGPIATDSKGSEGLNANCILWDELHVASAEFASVLRGATISRSEPLTFAISTAGADADSFGYQIYKQGKTEEKSQTPPLDKLFVDFSAPQDLTNAELDKDFEKYAKIANPSYGTLIDPLEIKADYLDCKDSPSKLSAFKRYRLGIWNLQARESLISPDDWAACQWKGAAREFLKAHRKKTCALGLDLSTINDFTAACFSWLNDDETISLFFRCWMPERTIKLMAKHHKEEFAQWYADGHILKGGDEVIDQQLVQRDIRRVALKCFVKEIGYDPTFAAMCVQQLSYGLIGQNNETLIEGIGGKLIEFRQTADVMSRPIADFERMAVAHRLRVYPNPCVDWQIGNVQAKDDGFGKKKIEKTEGWKKIDAALAGIMSVSRSLIAPKKPSISVI